MTPALKMKTTLFSILALEAATTMALPKASPMEVVPSKTSNKLSVKVSNVLQGLRSILVAAQIPASFLAQDLMAAQKLPFSHKTKTNSTTALHKVNFIGLSTHFHSANTNRYWRNCWLYM